ncbi:RiPP maturation radical SAM C-methyltransferase [Thermodesulfobacteriota bacterium]
MNFDVILVVPPFAPITGPLLGPSVLLPQLRNRGISAKVYYANIVLASEIGTRAYGHFTGMETQGGGIIGEALFSHWAGCRHPELEEARQEIAGMLVHREREGAIVGTTAVQPKGRQVLHGVDRCLDAIPGFLDKACTDILGDSPKVVGLTASYAHLAGSIALARRLKTEAPDLITVMGGPYATSPMGKAIGNSCGVFDSIFSGEADFEFPRFVEDFCERGLLPGENVIECPPVSNLDDVSIPDYDDYFEQKAETLPDVGDGKDLVNGLLFETSRDCWWAVKNPCTFCGIDPPCGPARRKSPDRVIEEMRALAKRYGAGKLVTADDAFPREYFKTLLPKFAATEYHLPDLELNVRPDLRADDLDTMQQAGVTNLLSGIESFSTVLLRKLNKGVTAQQNLSLLRDCRSRNIPLTYCLLMGVPGEDPEEYRAMINLIPKLEHLQPPRFLLPVKIIRSSKYFREPERYGITGISPAPIYRLVFGDEADLASIAYDFRATFPSEFLKDDSLREEFSGTVDAWCKSWQNRRPLPVLRRVSLFPGRQGVRDTRDCAVQEFYSPDDGEFVLLDQLVSPRRRSNLPEGLGAGLDNLLDRHYVVDHEGYLLSVVTSLDVPSGLNRRHVAD